ncbi:MAG: hypothetical protein WA109_08350 [Bellilinea sp.]
MLQKFVKILGGDPNKREIERLAARAEEINALEPEFEKLTDTELRTKTEEFRARLAEGETLDDLLDEAFAAVREASKRTIGLRHYEVQLIGGMALNEGTIAEMRTGEGKTLVATLPLYLNALTGRGVHLVTVNDYLARRDARWMAPVYHLLGLSVGVLQMASRTENGRKAFIVDPEKTSPFEDQHQLRLVDRFEAYQADITYGTNSEFGFDYLRDNLTNRLQDRSQRGHYYAIVDEVDNILIDEARTPLIISGPASDDTEWYVKMAQIVRALNPEDYEINERDRTVTMTEVGQAHVEEMLDMSLGDPERPEDIAPEQARVLGHLEQALKAQFLFRRNKDYLVQTGKVVIVDEFTGRLMPGRRWSEGLHQAVEAKEGVKVEPENVTYATITIQNYFRMYEKLAGMTGTALTEAEEFHKIYKLNVLPIPTNLEYNAIRPNPTIKEVNDKDDQGYKYTYYARKDGNDLTPVFWKRKDYPDVIYRTEEAKIRSITQEIIRYHVIGRPQLVGTTSVEHSDRLSLRLQPELLRRLTQAMLIRDAWLKKNNREESEIAIPELQWLYRSLPDLNAGEMRQFARTVGMNSISPEDAGNLERLLALLDLAPADAPRLVKVLQGGVDHKVLNARKHDEESQIIAGAGAFGAVTIATNMAGRGVDIKLGGELNDEWVNAVIRVLNQPGMDPYEMTNQERRNALRRMTEEDYSIYAEGVHAFLQYMDEMDKVHELGGLHVIGSERHEARRIDNQLRGRAARQGDPGSSRFYLSLEDELMRLFGGDQVEGLLTRLKIDESLPIENTLVARLVEQSQTRVEGSNFDVRKHLLEYDDVLNMQRKRIYEQRDRVFTKDDLSEDVDDMLRSELHSRVAAVAGDEEGPWKLLAFLDETQPPMDGEGIVYPSFTQRLLIDDLKNNLAEPTVNAGLLRNALLKLAANSLEAERQHLMKSAETLLQRTEETIEQARLERFETLDTFFQGLPDRVEEAGGSLRAQEVLDELSGLVRIPLRLSPDEMRRLTSGDDGVSDTLREQMDTLIVQLNLVRLIGTLQRRVDDLDLKPAQFQGMEWQDIANQVLNQLDATLARRTDQLAAPGAAIDRDLEAAFEKAGDGLIDLEQNLHALMGLLAVMAQGTKVSFDRRTHRRGQQRIIRLTYFFHAAHLIDDREPGELEAYILEHLQGAQVAQQQLWGRFEFSRLAQSGVTLSQLDARVQDQLTEELGAERYLEAASLPLKDLASEEIGKVVGVLGKRLQNEIYREVLLSVISNLWVDYLTRVDALRVSIGLEAFAQRDPLVQYKGKASEMFQTLLAEIRSGVVGRMLTYQPSRRSTASVDKDKPAAEIPLAAPGTGSDDGDSRADRKKKRRRH